MLEPLDILDGEEPPAGDFAAYIEAARAREAALVAIAPVFHVPAVFDRVMTLVEKPAGRSVQEPLWSKLFSPYAPDTYVVPRLDAAQASRVAKALINIELSHPQIHARNAAGQALHLFSPKAAEVALIAALAGYAERFAKQTAPGFELDHGKTERSQLEAVTANLYNAVVGLGTPAARTALVERIFTEKRSYWQLGAAIGAAFDAPLHLEALAALEKRRACAGPYAYALSEHVKSGPALVELARMIVDWEPVSDDKAQHHYALAVCQVAALAAHDYELVGKLERAREAIFVDPVCPDDVGRAIGDPDRAARWRDPFDDEALLARLRRVRTGEAARDREALVAALAAARVANMPMTTITDEQLGSIAGTTVTERLHVDRNTGEIWFCDADDRVFVFDGYAIVEPAFDHEPSLERGERIDDRAMWWDTARTRFREAIRIGEQLVIVRGANGATPISTLLVFADEDAAASAMMRLRAHPLDGYASTDPYYLAGRGAIVRTYFLPDGHGTRESIWCRDPEAVVEHARRELQWMVRSGATLVCVAHAMQYRRREDMTVREWIASRFRDDTKDAIWHLEALGELAAYLDAYGLRSVLPELDLQLGAPASDDDIEALATERALPLPEVLASLWRAHGRASWKLGTIGRRLLGPREVLARRAATGADVIVESLDGHVFAHVDHGWESALAVMLADLERELVTVAPIFDRLAYGQRAERQERAVSLVKDGVYWEAIVDLDTGVAVVRDQGGTTIDRIDPAGAEAWLDARAAEKWALGYRNPDVATKKPKPKTKPKPKSKTKKPKTKPKPKPKTKPKRKLPSARK